MAVEWIAAYGRHSHIIGRVLLICTVVLFFGTLFDWLGWLPFERGFQPLRTVLLSGALVLQSVAALVQQRSMILSWGLLAGSMVLIGAMFTVAS